MSQPSFPNLIEIAGRVGRRETSAQEVLAQAIAQAESHQDRYRPFIAITKQLARQQAKRVDEQIAQGKQLPLAGVPFAVKDLIDVQGIPTTAGSDAFRQNIARADATVVRRLVQAGGVLLGKLNLHECAFGFTGENEVFGNCRNPWNAERITGGSSSGSAVAIALGICAMTLGSDAGGSVRLPAAFCGLTGLKPTYGRVSCAGGMPLSWTMDHIGSVTRTAEETAAVLNLLAGKDAPDEASAEKPVPDFREQLNMPVEGMRIGIPRKWFFDALQPEVEQAIDRAIEKLVAMGARTVELELPHMHEVLGAHRQIIFSEAASFYQPYLQDRAERFTAEIRTNLLSGLFIPAVDYLKAQRVRRLVCAAWKQVFEQVDCLVTPTVPIVAPKFGQQTARIAGREIPLVRACLDLSLPFNFSGHPAISIPCGFSPAGLPVGLQLVGRLWAESTILRVAHQYQQATRWHQQVPPPLA